MFPFVTIELTLLGPACLGTEILDFCHLYGRVHRFLPGYW